MMFELDLTNFSAGQTIFYCSSCGWQIPKPNMACKNECPNCYPKRGLDWITVTDDMLSLYQIGRREIED